MVDIFEERASMRQGSQKPAGDIFEQRASLRNKPSKPQEPIDFERAGKVASSSYAGGVGGIGGDILNLFRSASQIPGATGLSSIPEIPGTHELSSQFQEQFGTEGPQNSFERILSTAAQFSGQETTLGAATGGPVGAGLGAAHGAASGALFQGLVELGMPEEWALLTTAITTLSPIAARELAPKISNWMKQGRTVEEAATLAEEELLNAGQAGKEGTSAPFQFGGPPQGKGGGLGEEFTAPQGLEAQEIPAGRTGYELAEEALDVLKRPPEEAAIISAKPPALTEEAKSLKGRTKILDKSIGKDISPDRFYNEKHGGGELSGRVKREAELERKPFEKKYEQSEREFKGKNDVYARLASENEQIISDLEALPERNAGEEAVYKKAIALRNKIGTPDALIEYPLSNLIRYSNSISGIANYDMPYVGPKGLLRSMAKNINESVLEAAERQGLNTKTFREADALYGKWADRFLNDEISSYLAKKNRNPEALFRRAVEDEATYRAIRDALGKKGEKTTGKLERSIVESRTRPYAKNIEKVGSEQYNTDMANLEGLIGKDKTNKVKARLKKEQSFPRPKCAEKVGTESDALRRIKEKVPRGYADVTPSELEQLMNTKEGVRQLKKDLKARGQEELFDRLAEEKTLDILRGGVVSPEKIKGMDIYNEIRKPHNYDILTEIYGKEPINTLLTDLMISYKKEINKEKLIRLAKMGASAAGAAKLFKVISILFL